MPVKPFSALTCPIDGQPLTLKDTAWKCPAGHSFDTARQGYVHLLPVQNKRSKEPGDSKAMVAARRQFLNGGYYQPIAEAVSQRAFELRSEDAAVWSCLDAGCGEGYYLRQLAAAQPVLDIELIGVDISKWATLAAAKQDRGQDKSRWIVGTNARLPVQPSTLDCVLCLFGFPVYDEFHRVLKPGGYVIQVDAGSDHLRELREIVYDTVKPPRQTTEAPPQGFTCLSTQEVHYPLVLESPEVIADLLAMTPHLYRANAEGRARAETLTSLTVTVDVRITVFAASSA